MQDVFTCTILHSHVPSFTHLCTHHRLYTSHRTQSSTQALKHSSTQGVLVEASNASNAHAKDVRACNWVITVVLIRREALSPFLKHAYGLRSLVGALMDRSTAAAAAAALNQHVVIGGHLAANHSWVNGQMAFRRDPPQTPEQSSEPVQSEQSEPVSEPVQSEPVPETISSDSSDSTDSDDSDESVVNSY